MEWGFCAAGRGGQQGRAAGQPLGAAATKGGLCLSSCVGLILEHVGRVGGCLQDTNKRRFFCSFVGGGLKGCLPFSNVLVNPVKAQ